MLPMVLDEVSSHEEKDNQGRDRVNTQLSEVCPALAAESHDDQGGGRRREPDEQRMQWKRPDRSTWRRLYTKDILANDGDTEDVEQHQEQDADFQNHAEPALPPLSYRTESTISLYVGFRGSRRIIASNGGWSEMSRYIRLRRPQGAQLPQPDRREPRL